jgi:hypothetical protein
MHIHENWKTVILPFTEMFSRNGGLPEIPLATNIGTNAEMYKQPGLLDSLYEPDQIVPLFEIVLRENTIGIMCDLIMTAECKS